MARRRYSLAHDAPDRIAVSPLVLQASHSLTIRVVHRGAPVPRAAVAVLASDEYGVVTEPILAETDEAGQVEVGDLLAGALRVFAGAEGLGRGMAEGSLPAAAPLVVDLPAGRVLRVRVVCADAAGGGEKPVADAEVFLGDRWQAPAPSGGGVLPPLPALRTDAEGKVDVPGLPAGLLGVSARAPGLALPSRGMTLQHVAVPEDAAEVKVVLHPWQRLVFPAEVGNVEPPPDGTVLRVVQFQRLLAYDRSAPTARMEGRTVVIDGFPPGHDWGRVEAPDGRFAEWRIALGPDLLARADQEPVRFFASRDVAVRLTEPGGVPVPDAWVRVRVTPRGGAGPTRTDAAGFVAFPGLAGTMAHVFWSSTGEGFGEPVGEVDLTSPPGVTGIEVPPALRVRVRVTVDGEARLPGRYTLSLGERTLAPAEITEDPDRAELAFVCRPRASEAGVVVALRVPGHPPGEARLPSGIAGEPVLDLAVASSARVTLRVLPPEDGAYYLFVECWDEQNRRWFVPDDDPALVQARRGTREGVHVLEGPRPGRYRLHDIQSGEVSPPFDVRAGAAPSEVLFDLRDMATLEGRVVAPEGETAAFAQVFVRDGDDSGAFPVQGKTPAADGTFPVRVRRGQPVRLRVVHPVLRAADPEGRELVAGRDDFVLRLVRGPEIRFRVPGVETTTEAPDPRILTVGDAGWRVFAGAPGAPWRDAKPHVPIAVGGLWRLGLPAAGTFDLWFDLRGRAPVLLRDVVVGEGPVDLGTLDVGEGSVLRLRLTTKGRDVPHLPLVVEHLGEPPYQRSPVAVPRPAGTPPEEPREFRVPGLGAGRFRVRLYDPLPPRPGASPGPLLERTIEVDGRHEILLEAELP